MTTLQRENEGLIDKAYSSPTKDPHKHDTEGRFSNLAEKSLFTEIASTRENIESKPTSPPTYYDLRYPTDQNRESNNALVEEKPDSHIFNRTFWDVSDDNVFAFQLNKDQNISQELYNLESPLKNRQISTTKREAAGSLDHKSKFVAETDYKKPEVIYAPKDFGTQVNIPDLSLQKKEQVRSKNKNFRIKSHSYSDKSDQSQQNHSFLKSRREPKSDLSNSKNRDISFETNKKATSHEDREISSKNVDNEGAQFNPQLPKQDYIPLKNEYKERTVLNNPFEVKNNILQPINQDQAVYDILRNIYEDGAGLSNLLEGTHSIQQPFGCSNTGHNPLEHVYDDGAGLSNLLESTHSIPQPFGCSNTGHNPLEHMHNDGAGLSNLLESTHSIQQPVGCSNTGHNPLEHMYNDGAGLSNLLESTHSIPQPAHKILSSYNLMKYFPQ